MATSQSLSTAPPEHLAMDFAALRAAGISLLQRLAGQQWTDFNTHDPGVTILEQLCYALTDLAYRIDYDLKDLLADGQPAPYRALYSPAEILTTEPVTLADLRKVVIDCDGVKNAWIEPVEAAPALHYDPADQGLYLEAAPHRAPLVLRGVYRALIEADGSLPDLEVAAAVQRRLQACRNLGQAFEPAVVLRRQPITVTARIEVGAVADPDRLLAEIYHALARFISPRLRFSTLAELLARGRSIDAIMDGPPLRHGFIDADELERFDRRIGLRGSDIIRQLLDVPGVSAVDELTLSDGVTTDPWYLDLSRTRSQNSTPVLDIQAPGFGAPTLKLLRSGVELLGRPARVKQLFDELQRAEQAQPLPEAERDLRLPPGRDRKVGRYHSIQHQFPAVYGIGELGLPDAAPPQRQAQARQLKAYLLLFDQLLANAFAQLAHIQELFAFDAPRPRSYFTQLIDDPRLGLDEDKIWRTEDPATRAANLQALVEDQAGGAVRKNRFLDHLLARFAEEFADYSQHLATPAAPEELLAAKSAFLRDYRTLGRERGRAFDATMPAWDSANIAGLEQRIGRKLGLAGVLRRDLADLDDGGGFHMIEPILLRPHPADLAQWTQTSDAVGWQAPALLTLPTPGDQPPRRDPFSARLCFVFPDWSQRFDRDFVWRIVREETPAHLELQLQWLSKPELRAFETAYKDWLASTLADAGALGSPETTASLRTRAARDRLIDLLQLGNPYPLRDLEPSYPQKVAPRKSADIVISSAQIGVRYQLCDQDGNPLLAGGSPISATRTSDQPDERVVLQTPPINEDTTFTILAARDTDAHGAPLALPLESYLRATISIKVGIDTGLPVEPVPAAGQASAGARITISYGDTVTVAVNNSQEGISYLLIKAGDDAALSKPVQGNKAGILLVSPALTEDSELQVKAYRTQARSNSERLATTVAVLVRPNPSVALAIEPAAPPIVAYGAGATLSIADPQASATYQLYRRQLVPTDYVTDATPGRLAVPGSDVFVRSPERAAGGEPAGFELVGAFAAAGQQQTIASGSLTEDSIFVVLAAKTTNPERLRLDQALVVLVRPDPEPAVAARPASVTRATDGLVVVSGTQRGVLYQLFSGDTPINAPGYDYRDRGVGAARVAVDLVVEAPTDQQAAEELLLPTGPVTKKTTYTVLATRILSGVSTLLSGKATIAVSRGTAGGSGADADAGSPADTSP